MDLTELTLDGTKIKANASSDTRRCASLSDTATWNNTTLTGLGFTVGTYTYNWGSGPTADSIALNIGATPTPEPGSQYLVAMGGIGLAFYRRRNRAGNVSAPATASVTIDMTAPTVTAIVSPSPNAAGWNNTSTGAIAFGSAKAPTAVSNPTPCLFRFVRSLFSSQSKRVTHLHFSSYTGHPCDSSVGPA